MDNVSITRDHGGNVGEIARLRGIDESTIIDFSASINPLGYPQGLRAAINGRLDSILHYPDIDAHDLTEALAGYHTAVPEHIAVGSGSTEFFYLIPQIMKPRTALIVSPAFSEYEKGLRMAGTDVSYFPTNKEQNFEIDAPALCEMLRNRYDLLYICNPANPTGVLTPKETLHRILMCARDAGTLTLVDEAFVDFVEEASLKSEIPAFHDLIVVRSMTKFFGLPGMRIGYIISSSRWVTAIRHGKTPWSVSSLAQIAATAALGDTAFIGATRSYIAQEKLFLKDTLNTVPYIIAYDSAANYLFIAVDDKTGLTSTQVRDRLIPEGILIRDCSTFQGLGDRYFRVAVKRHDQNVILVDALRRIFEG